MKIEYFKEYSHCLNRDMEFKVYGHGGKPILVFPAQNGRFYDFENFNMVYSIEHLINSGKVQLFCCDSIDKESWSDIFGDKRHRIYMHEQWYYYIVDELVPRIFEINKNSNGYYANGILTTGCSMEQLMRLILCLEDQIYLMDVLVLVAIMIVILFFMTIVMI